MDTLEKRFLLRTRDDIEHLKTLANRAMNGDWKVLEDLLHTSHSIHGAAAIFAFTKLSLAAGAIEHVVDNMLRASVTTRSGSSDMLALIEGMKELERAATASGAPGGPVFDIIPR